MGPFYLMRLFSVLALLPLSAHAQSGPSYFDPSQVNITYGVFCAVQTEGTKDAPGTEAGAISLYTDVPDFEWATSVVPAMLGITFGVKVEILNGSDMDNILMSVTHPPFAGSGRVEDAYFTDFEIVNENINAFSFDEPYEMQPGDWVFVATQEGKQIYRMEFKVVDPSVIPTIAGACHGNMLS